MVCGWPTGGSLLEAWGASFVNFVKIEDFVGTYMPIKIRILINLYMPVEVWDFDWYMPIEISIFLGTCPLNSAPSEFELATLSCCNYSSISCNPVTVW